MGRIARGFLYFCCTFSLFSVLNGCFCVIQHGQFARTRLPQRGLCQYAQDTQRVRVPCRCIAPRTRTMAAGIAPLPALLGPGIRARRRHRPLGAAQKNRRFPSPMRRPRIFMCNPCVNYVEIIEPFTLSWYNTPKSTERSLHYGFYTHKPYHPD